MYLYQKLKVGSVQQYYTEEEARQGYGVVKMVICLHCGIDKPAEHEMN
jgi:hypothetical protein